MFRKDFVGVLIGLAVIIWFVSAMPGMKLAMAGDVPVETGIVKEVGDNSILVVIKNGNGFEDGAKITFYTHKKTKIIMAESKTPITLSSLLIGDLVQITLGPVETGEDGTVKRYADRINVLGKKRLRHRKRGLERKS